MTGPAGNDMPAGAPHLDEYRQVVRRFVRAQRVAILAAFPPELATMLPFRNAVLDMMESDVLIDETANALLKLHGDTATTGVTHLLVLELEGASAMIGDAKPPAEAAAVRPWWKRALSVSVTATGSLREILEAFLGPKGKALWKLFEEVQQIAKGD